MITQPNKTWRAGWIVVGLLLAGAVVMMAAVAIWFGALNQDEGWYLYAGRLVYEGRRPFHDFASTQGPVMAYLYSLSWPLVRIGGVLAGRIFTAVMGLLTILLTAWLAYRLADQTDKAEGRCQGESGVVAALFAAGLLGLSLYHVYFTSLVKTYGATGLLVVAGFCCLAGALRKARSDGSAKSTFLLGFLTAGAFAIAAGTRLSAGILLPAVWLPLATGWIRGHGAMRRGLLPLLIGMLVGGTLGLAAIYVPLLLAVPDALAFGLLDYHAAREVGSPAVKLAYKAGFLLRLCRSYFPLLVMGVIGVVGWLNQRGQCTNATQPFPRLPVLLGSGLLAVTLIHLLAPFPYDDYQVFIMPCAVLLVAPAAARLLQRLPVSTAKRLAMVVGTLLLVLVHSLSSPLLQDWLVDGRNRIWWPLKTETDLQGLRRAAKAVRAAGGKLTNKVLLTQDTYLAVEAGWHVPEGMELGPFCFFPGLDDEDADRLNVLNETRYLDIMTDGMCGVAAFSDWGLAIRAPEIVPVDTHRLLRLEQTLQRYYSPFENIEQFGQGGTPLRIMRRYPTP